MYRLLVYGLGGLAVISIVLAAFGSLSLDPAIMTASLAILLASVFGTEFILSKLWHRPMNAESWLITALILFFILQPPTSIVSGVLLGVAGLVASASKYILSWRGKHIFNPAAIAAALLSLTALWPASWWVGSTALWWLTLPLGILIVRKIHQGWLVLAFAGVSIGLQTIQFVTSHQPLQSSLQHTLVASPLIFLATIMLTEPATMPSRRYQQIIFSALTAVFYVSGWSIGPMYIYPEVALLLGNLYAFIVSPKLSIAMRLMRVQPVSGAVANFIFEPERAFRFQPGQYMEWTLPGVAFDGRGNRRMFSLASSPTENQVMLGVKFYNPTSTYKYRLQHLKPGDIIHASQLTGGFTLPRDASKKLVFIAGGIGITPFRSMIRYLLDTDQQRDVTLIYAVSDEKEFAYLDVLSEARQAGMPVHLIATGQRKQPIDGVQYGRFDAEAIKQFLPDYTERLFYVSGPHGMVESTKHQLASLGVGRLRIKSDHFSGY